MTRHAELDGEHRAAAADKVPGFDPAAAPLGTDDESAGQPAPPPGRRTGAAPREQPAIAADSAGTERRPYRAQDRVIWSAVAVAIVAAAGAVLVALLAA